MIISKTNIELIDKAYAQGIADQRAEDARVNPHLQVIIPDLKKQIEELKSAISIEKVCAKIVPMAMLLAIDSPTPHQHTEVQLIDIAARYGYLVED